MSPNRERSFFNLQDAEEKVLENLRNYGKRKKADGSVEEYSSAKKNDTLNRDSVETAKLDFFEDYRVSKKLLVPIDENAIEIDMMERIAFHGKTVASLLEELIFLTIYTTTRFKSLLILSYLLL